MASVTVQHEFVTLKNLSKRIEARLADDWELIQILPLTANPAENPEAKFLLVFSRKGK